MIVKTVFNLKSMFLNLKKKIINVILFLTICKVFYRFEDIAPCSLHSPVATLLWSSPARQPQAAHANKSFV